MVMLSLAGVRLDQFLFLGFLPAESEKRKIALADLKRQALPSVLMDTPYRLAKLLVELAALFPERKAILGMDLTKQSEKIIEGSLRSIQSKVGDTKAEFILILARP